jgi:PKD repeat protein
MLTWQDNSSNETRFDIERCEGASCTNFANLASQWANTPSYTDYSALSDRAYRYRVRAWNTGGSSPWSNIADVPPMSANQRPTAVMSALPSTGTAPLTVTFDGRGSTDSDGTVSSWAWNFGDGSVGGGALITHVYSNPGTYTALLTVTDNSGASGTATRSIVVSAAAVPAPSNLTATAVTSNSIVLRWANGSGDQTQVRIERCRGTGCTSFAQIAAVGGTATTYTDVGLSVNTVYRYRVRAYRSIVSSPYSNIASTRTLRR